MNHVYISFIFFMKNVRRKCQLQNKGICVDQGQYPSYLKTPPQINMKQNVMIIYWPVKNKVSTQFCVVIKHTLQLNYIISTK